MLKNCCSLEDAGSVLRSGGLVAFPTETFFGLAAQPSSHKAIEELRVLKGRDLGAGIPLIVSSAEIVENLVDDEPDSVREMRRELQQKFWPGPLTIVISARGMSSTIHESVFGPDASLAVRVSSRVEASDLARAAGGLITSTSANPKGEAPASKSEHVCKYFSLLSILDPSTNFESHSQPSTILDVRGEVLKILREGAISSAEIFGS